MKSGLVFGVVFTSAFALTIPLLVDWHHSKISHRAPAPVQQVKESPPLQQAPLEADEQSGDRLNAQKECELPQQVNKRGEEGQKCQKEPLDLAARPKLPPDPESAQRQRRLKDLARQLQGKGDQLTVKDAQEAVRLFAQLDEDDLPFAQETCATLRTIFAGAADQKVAALTRSLDSIMKKFTMVGQPFDISGRTTDGQMFDLKNLKGKIVLVDFWATWCPPCVAEIPNIIRAHEKYQHKGFEVIGVSLDRKDEAIAKFADAKKLPWSCINVQDSRKLAERYGIYAIPQPILVGRDGRIASMQARGPQLDRLLDRLLNQASYRS